MTARKLAEDRGGARIEGGLHPSRRDLRGGTRRGAGLHQGRRGLPQSRRSRRCQRPVFLGHLLACWQGVEKDRRRRRRTCSRRPPRRATPWRNTMSPSSISTAGDASADEIKAAEWMQKAAEAESASGAIRSRRLLSIRPRRHQRTGRRPRNGPGKAAEAGMPEAQVEYGVMLFKGEGVAIDEKRAARMFRLAAERGNAGGPEPARPPLCQWRGGRPRRSGPGRQVASPCPRGWRRRFHSRRRCWPSSRRSSAPQPRRRREDWREEGLSN